MFHSEGCGCEACGDMLREDIADEFAAFDGYSMAEDSEEGMAEDAEPCDDPRTLRGAPVGFAREWMAYLEDSENVF